MATRKRTKTTTKAKTKTKEKTRTKTKRPKVTADGMVEIQAGTSFAAVAALFERLSRGEKPTTKAGKATTALDALREAAGRPGRAGPSLQPDLALALCIGPDPDDLDALVASLQSDLEEMRWDGGSRAAEHSALIPELEALVEEAGDPYAVPDEALAALVKKHSAPADSAKADELRDEIDRFSP